MALSTPDLFKKFFQSEKTGGFVLIGCTVISLLLANLWNGGAYTAFWHSTIDLSFSGVVLNYTLEHWINDGLMTVFFLLVGLEIERELYVGELSTLKTALLPFIAAAGGMICPALLHFYFNAGTPTQSGFGIPMATDIAFALGILSLAGKGVPVSLKVFLAALAIIDDLGAITVIALFYTKDFLPLYFGTALLIFAVLFFLGKRRFNVLPVYLAGGIIMWYCMLRSGVHPTISGVLLAFALPFHPEEKRNISFKLQRALHYPVAFLILPVFALANTAIIFPTGFLNSFTTKNSLGILTGLCAGKLTGILGFSFAAVKAGVAQLSPDLGWRHVAGIGLLGGIGFTMSIFITALAFTDANIITASKMSILVASLISAVGGLLLISTIRVRPPVTAIKES